MAAARCHAVVRARERHGGGAQHGPPGPQPGQLAPPGAAAYQTRHPHRVRQRMLEFYWRRFADGKPAAVGHGAFAEFERALIRERQQEGIALAKRREAYRGRKKALVNNRVVELRRRAGTGEQKAGSHQPPLRPFGINDIMRLAKRLGGTAPTLDSHTRPRCKNQQGLIA